MQKLQGFKIITDYLKTIKKTIKKIGIDNLEEYEIFYRGESKYYNTTIPSVFRSKDDLHNEHKYFRELELRYPSIFDNAKNTIDKLAIMQHYGLPTRLLDLTTNPLLALYMAIGKEDLSNICPTIKIIFVKKDAMKYYDSDTVSVFANFAKIKPNTNVNLYRFANNKNNNIKVAKHGIGSINYTYLDTYEKIKNLDLPQKYQAGKLICKDNDYLHYLLHEIKAEKPYFKDLIWLEHLDQSVIFVKPKHNSQRLINQAGLFALFGLNNGQKQGFSLEDFSTKSKDFKINTFSLCKCIKKKENLCTKSFIQELKATLGILGITQDKVYPEMEHASKYIKDLLYKT